MKNRKTPSRKRIFPKKIVKKLLYFFNVKKGSIESLYQILLNMKIWKTTLIALVCAMICGTANAQFHGSYRVNPRNPYGGAYTGRFKQRPQHARFRRGFSTEGWNQFDFQMKWDNMKFDNSSLKNAKLTTISVGLNHGARMMPMSPVFFDGGISLEYSWDNTEYLRKFNNFALVVPLGLDFMIPAGYVDIIPYTGIFLRLNIAGEAHDRSLYTDDNTYGEWNRFQAGWQIGSKLRFNPFFHVGIAYARDLTSWNEEIGAKRGAFIVSTGVDF